MDEIMECFSEPALARHHLIQRLNNMFPKMMLCNNDVQLAIEEISEVLPSARTIVSQDTACRILTEECPQLLDNWIRDPLKTEAQMRRKLPLIILAIEAMRQSSAGSAAHTRQLDAETGNLLVRTRMTAPGR